MEQQEKTCFDTGFVNRITELPITIREREILLHLAQGKTNKEISKDLFLSPSTVRNHISNIFTKLKISNRSQATRIAIYSGLLSDAVSEVERSEAEIIEASSI